MWTSGCAQRCCNGRGMRRRRLLLHRRLWALRTRLPRRASQGQRDDGKKAKPFECVHTCSYSLVSFVSSTMRAASLLSSISCWTMSQQRERYPSESTNEIRIHVARRRHILLVERGRRGDPFALWRLYAILGRNRIRPSCESAAKANRIRRIRGWSDKRESDAPKTRLVQ